MIFIAEIGMNHNGNLDLAFELIKQAKYAGADVAKFQLGWRGKEGELNHIDKSWLLQLQKWCDYFEIELMVSIFTQDALLMTRGMNLKRYKIASRTLKDNFDLVEEIVKDGKETIISLGMWEDDKLPFLDKDNIKYLWCKSKYPATPWDLIDMPKEFSSEKYYGYSDHSIGIEIPLLAISRGAKIIEKHFTLDKSDTTIRDHILSTTPDEFRILTQVGRSMSKFLDLKI